MAFSRIQSIFTYKTSKGGQDYLYDLVLDAQSLFSVRNIRGPRGLITDSLTGLPQDVVQDIQDAMEQSQLLVSDSSVVSGTSNFTGQVSRAIAIAPGLLNNINYRVHVTSPDGTPLRVENKATTGFTLVAPAVYGAAGDVKKVDWVVYVSTAAASALGGVVTFVFADSSAKTITFPTSLPSDNYRVLLEPSGFFPVRISQKTKSGFTIALGMELQNNGESVTVGYDVVV